MQEKTMDSRLMDARRLYRALNGLTPERVKEILGVEIKRAHELMSGFTVRVSERRRMDTILKAYDRRGKDGVDALRPLGTKYTLDGEKCISFDYEAMEDFERKCYECGSTYGWREWEDLPLLATGKLVSDNTPGDVKRCKCGKATWIAPAYRLAETGLERGLADG